MTIKSNNIVQIVETPIKEIKEALHFMQEEKEGE